MKKALRLASLLLVFALLFGALGLTAWAAEDTYAPLYTKQADILKDLGLFLGTNTGYHLERTATRAEAAVMLVRLLGAEQEAQDGTYEHPFSDVPDWAEAAVGYLFTNGLTNGVSMEKKLFGSSQLCDAKMYATFVLRALEYNDITGNDFAYNDAISAAVLYGVIDAGLADGLAGKDFLRDDMVALSFCGLTANLKGETEKSLIDKLIGDGAVASDKVTSCRNDLDAYTAYRKAAWLGAQAKDLDATISMIMDMEMSGEKIATTTEMSLVAEGLDNPAKATMKMTATMKIDDGSGPQNVTMTMYMKDGWSYLSMDIPDTDALKVKINMLPVITELQSASVGDLMAVLGQATGGLVDMSQVPAASNMLAATLVSFNTTADGKTAVYQAGGMPLTCVYDNTGRLKTQKMSMDLSTNVDGVALLMKMDMTMNVNYPSGGVKVDLSGLKESDYTEVPLSSL